MKNKISKSQKKTKKKPETATEKTWLETQRFDVTGGKSLCVCTFTVTRMAPVQLIFPLLQVKSFSFNHHNL